jgi:hypothetical protein
MRLVSGGRPHRVERLGPNATRFLCSSVPGSGAAGLWCGTDTGEEQVAPGCGAAIALGTGDHNPGTSRPVGFDVFRRLLGP